MSWRDMLLHEWRTRLGRPAALFSLSAFLVVMIFAAIGGRIERNSRAHVIAAHHAQAAVDMQRWLSDLRALETRGEQAGVPPWSGSPMDLEFASSLPPAPLADFSIGQSDLSPSVGALSLWDPDVRLFSRYEFEDPWALALGSLDLSKTIVLLLPLLMIVLSFDIVSADRDAGRLGLLVAQGADLRRLVWRRLLSRCGAVMALALLIALAAFLLNGAAGAVRARLPGFSLWAATASLYGAFWFALIGCISSRDGRGESNVMRLLLCWAGLTLIIPAATTSIAEATYPPPSRLAYLAEARRIEIETERAEDGIAQGFFNDHPELSVDSASEMPAYLRTAFFATSTVDAATRPLLDAFETTLRRRDEALDLLRYASPAIIAHQVFNEAAGASSARHRRYMMQARAFKAAYAAQAGPYIASGRRMPSDRVIAFGLFHFEDLPFRLVLRSILPALAFLALASGFLLWIADRRLHRLARPLTS